MKKMKIALGALTLLTVVAIIGCNNNQPAPCLPVFVHSGYSDSLAAINHTLSFADAKAMIKRYVEYRKGKRNKNDSITVPYYETFNRQAVYDLLKQDSTIGIRIYYGLTANNKLVQILIGTKPNGRGNSNNLKEMGQTPPGNTDSISVDKFVNSIDAP